MKKIIWDETKNQLLKLNRDICFEDILDKIELGEIIARKVHPNQEKYPHQQIFVFDINNYMCYVPFVENDNEILLKTIIFSRKLNKEYKK
jgi:uncharacterized DUF497 family protein